MPIETTDDLDVFFDPEEFGETAVYQDVTGITRAIGVIRIRPDVEVGFGDGAIVMETDQFQIRRSDVERPGAGDMMTVVQVNPDDGIKRETQYRVNSGAVIDARRTIWTVTCEPAQF